MAERMSFVWWRAVAPTGHPFYHNTATNETTWIAPMPPTEENLAELGEESLGLATLTLTGIRADVEHETMFCKDRFDKEIKLIDLLQSCAGQAIVFSSSNGACDALGRSLECLGFSIETIHGDKDESGRNAALGAFESGRSKILVATDVAAPNVQANELVVNFDPPENAVSYVHRIGRAARAVTLLSSGQESKGRMILEVVRLSHNAILQAALSCVLSEL